MPQELPFKPSEPHYDFPTVIDGLPCKFEVRWNALDSAWYFDILNEDGSPVAHGIKVVLGVHLGRRVNHPITRNGVLVAIDLSGDARDAGFDDMGTRVRVWHFTKFEIVTEIQRQS
jgi:hypothetical protein